MNICDQIFVKLIHCGNINPVNSEDVQQKNTFYMPMGLFPLASSLRQNKHQVQIIHSDLTRGQSFIDSLELNKLDVVGLDCHWVNQGLAVIETAAMIKKIKPEVFIFLGGYTASLFHEEIINDFPQIDAVIRGDGEIPVVELCNALCSTKYLTGSMDLDNSMILGKIKNLTWRNKDNRIMVNELSYTGTSSDMDGMDFTALEFLKDWECYRDLSRFWTRFEPVKSSPLFLVSVGRGCQYACLFCGGNCEAQKRIANRKRTIFRSVDSVIHTIKEAQSLGFETFYSCMESEESDEWYIALMKKIRQEKIKINYVYGSWRLPSKELIDILSESCNHVIFEISPETSDESLRKENKDTRIFYTNKQLEDCLDYISQKENMNVQLYFGYFLVHDTKEKIISTIDYIIKLAIKYQGLVEMEYFNFSTDPGSLIFFDPERYDIDMKVRSFRDYLNHIKLKYTIQKNQSADLRVFKPKGVSEADVKILENTITIFNLMFLAYRTAVSEILLKTGKSQLITQILTKDNTLDVNCDSLILLEWIKNSLLTVCSQAGMLNTNMMKCIYKGYELQKSRNINIKPTPQIWLCTEDEQTESVGDTVCDVLEYINLRSKGDKEIRKLEFDFDL